MLAIYGQRGPCAVVVDGDMNTALETRSTILASISVFPAVPGDCKAQGRGLSQ
jgi:hypothetical protein